MFFLCTLDKYVLSMINTIPDFCWALLNAYLTSEYDVMLWFKYSLDDTPVGLNGGDGGVLGVRVADVRVGDLCLVNEQLDWCVYSRIQWWRCFAHDLTHGPPVTKQNSEHTREVAESNRSHWQITLKQAHFSDFSGKKNVKLILACILSLMQFLYSSGFVFSFSSQ